MKRFFLLTICLFVVSASSFAKAVTMKSEKVQLARNVSGKNCESNYIDAKGNAIFSSELLNPYTVVGAFSDGLAPVKLGKKWGYIDKTGALKIAANYDEADIFSHGLAAVKLGKKWGYINKTGTTVIEPKYSEVTTFSEEDGMAAVRLGRVWGFVNADFVNTDKVEAVAPNYPSVGFFSEGLASVTLPTTGNTAFIDKTGKIIITMNYGDFPQYFHEGVAVFNTFNDSANSGIIPDPKFKNSCHCIGFIDKAGKITKIGNQYNSLGDFSKSLAAVAVVPKTKTGLYEAGSEKYGFINTNLELVIKDKYDFVSCFYEDRALVLLDSKWGFINTEGTEVVLPAYDEANRYHNDLAAVRQGKLWGFIDKSGTPVIPISYSWVSSFYDGVALVEKCSRY